MTTGIRDYKVSILAENYRVCVGEGENASFTEWIKNDSGNDPNFFHWLFDSDEPELDCGPGNHEEEWEEFLRWCETCDPFDM